MLNRTRFARYVFAVLLAAALPAAAEAQVFTPTYMSPRMSDDLGVYLSDGPGDLAIEGVLRRGALGLRAGFADVGDGALLIGGEYRNPLRVKAPLEVAFTAGAQGVLGDPDAVGVQAGLTIGHSFIPSGTSTTLTPYIHPRLALVDGGDPNDDFELDLLADIGIDVDLARHLILRVGINLGDGADWGVGIAWR